jgi:hypothetical protein
MTFENRTWFFTNDSSSRDADLRYLRSNENDVMEITVRLNRRADFHLEDFI